MQDNILRELLCIERYDTVTGKIMFSKGWLTRRLAQTGDNVLICCNWRFILSSRGNGV